MNIETIALHMTPNEADKIAHVLMASLHQPNFMLDGERKSAYEAAKELFRQLGYGYTCNAHGQRVELRPAAKQTPRPMMPAVSPDCEHPGVFAENGHDAGPVYCPSCNKNIPISEL